MAKFNSAWLISKRQFRSLTGIEVDTFRKLVDRLRPHWRERIVAPKNRSGRPWGVGDLEDHLLVLLILYRCAITQDFMACLYRTDKSTVSRSLQRIETLSNKMPNQLSTQNVLWAPLKINCWATVCQYQLTMKPFDQNFCVYHASAGSFFPQSQLQTDSSNKTHGEPAMARRSN